MVRDAEAVLSKADGVLFAADTIKKSIGNAERSLKAKQSNIEVLKEAERLARQCIQEQVGIRIYVEQMVTAVLRRVFPEYELEFAFDPVYRDDGVTLSGLRPIIVEHGTKLEPKDSHGEGVSDVITLALRTVFLKLYPTLSPVVFLDEPTVHLNPSKFPEVLAFFKELATCTPLQVVVITHEDVEADRVLRVTKNAQVATVSVEV